MSNTLKPITQAQLEHALQRCAEYVEEEAKSRCPVDTGNLRDSIHSSVEGTSVTIGTDVEYAPYVEYGTYKMAAQPFMIPAINSVEDKFKQLLLEEIV